MDPTDVIAEALLLHLYNSELEISLSPTCLRTNQLMLHERKYLNAGIEALKSWFEVFFKITPAAYIGFPFSIYTQLVRALNTLYRLTTLSDPSWNENGVWKTSDPLLILDRVINNMEQVEEFAGLDNSDSPEKGAFSQTAEIFRSLRPAWEAKLKPKDLSNISIPPSIDETSPPDPLAIEFFDSDWLMDLLFSPNF